MGEIFPLRGYQRECLDATARTFAETDFTRIANVLPTGAGKTVIFAHMSKEHLDVAPGKRIVVLVHTDELVNQAFKKIRGIAPHLRAGIIKAERCDVHAQVIIASVQSLGGAAPARVRKRQMVKDVDLIIVDECHHATAPTYRSILDHYGCRVVGFTATLVRADKSKLSDVWQAVSFKRDIAFMVRRGYLRNPRGKRIEVDDLDLSRVRTSRGDLQAGDLGEAMEVSMAPEVVAKAYREHAADRSGILFAPTVDAAYTFALALETEGFTVAVIHGGLAIDVRRKIIKQFEAGEIQILCNCMVLTEGFDSPRASCAVIARLTKSRGLYRQMVGRVLRTMPGTPDEALIMDVVGVSRSHDLASLIDLSERQIKRTDCDDMTLLELESELDAELEALLEGDEAGDCDFREEYAGPAIAKDFDPLARDSASRWLKTAGGTYFISAGTGRRATYVFLAPSIQPDAEPGEHDVMWCTKRDEDLINGLYGGVSEHVGLSWETAFGWGEDVADWQAENWGTNPYHQVTGRDATSRLAAERGKRPVKAQLAQCAELGIDVPKGATKGDVADLIATARATARIDPIIAIFETQRSATQ